MMHSRGAFLCITVGAFALLTLTCTLVFVTSPRGAYFLFRPEHLLVCIFELFIFDRYIISFSHFFTRFHCAFWAETIGQFYHLHMQYHTSYTILYHLNFSLIFKIVSFNLYSANKNFQPRVLRMTSAAQLCAIYGAMQEINFYLGIDFTFQFFLFHASLRCKFSCWTKSIENRWKYDYRVWIVKSFPVTTSHLTAN